MDFNRHQMGSYSADRVGTAGRWPKPGRSEPRDKQAG
jgi:hypothetical protein